MSLEKSTLLTVRKVNGNLVITPTRHGAAVARKHFRGDSCTTGQDNQLVSMLEVHLGNGWNEVHPKDVGALTDAFIMSDDGFINDDGHWEPHPDDEHPRVYAHMDYQVEDPIETWAKGQSVTFVGDEVQRK